MLLLCTTHNLWLKCCLFVTRASSHASQARIAMHATINCTLEHPSPAFASRMQPWNTLRYAKHIGMPRALLHLVSGKFRRILLHTKQLAGGVDHVAPIAPAAAQPASPRPDSQWGKPVVTTWVPQWKPCAGVHCSPQPRGRAREEVGRPLCRG